MFNITHLPFELLPTSLWLGLCLSWVEMMWGCECLTSDWRARLQIVYVVLISGFFPFLFQKRPVPFDSLERLAVKRQKLVDQRLQQQSTVNGLLKNKGHDNATPTVNHSFHTKTEFRGTTNHSGNQNASPEGHDSFPVAHKLSGTSDTPVTGNREQEPKGSDHQPPQGHSDCAHQQLTISQHRKKKSKKHKDKQRERLKDNKGSDCLVTSPDLKHSPEKLESKAPFNIDFLFNDICLRDFFFTVLIKPWNQHSDFGWVYLYLAAVYLNLNSYSRFEYSVMLQWSRPQDALCCHVSDLLLLLCTGLGKNKLTTHTLNRWPVVMMCEVSPGPTAHCCTYTVLSHKHACVCSLKLPLSSPQCVVWLIDSTTAQAALWVSKLRRLLTPTSSDTHAVTFGKTKTYCFTFGQWQKCHVWVFWQTNVVSFSVFCIFFSPDLDITKTVVSEEKPDFVLWV